MKKYILLVRNIYTQDEAYGPYEDLDSLRLYLYSIYGDDWTNQNFQTLELKNPYSLEKVSIKETTRN